MGSESIVFYYDCVSPWSYVGFEVLLRYRKAWGIPIELRPLSLSYIMKYANNSPPITVPNKGRLLMSEFQRVDRMYGRTSHTTNQCNSSSLSSFRSTRCLCSSSSLWSRNDSHKTLRR